MKKDFTLEGHKIGVQGAGEIASGATTTIRKKLRKRRGRQPVHEERFYIRERGNCGSGF